MIRILFIVLILAAVVGGWLFFLRAMGNGKKHWFWEAGGNHFVAIILSVIITSAIVLALAQPFAFLKYIFG